MEFLAEMVFPFRYLAAIGSAVTNCFAYGVVCIMWVDWRQGGYGQWSNLRIDI